MLGVRNHEPGILQFLLERGGVAAAADSRLVCERVGFVGCTSKIHGEGGAIYALGAAEVRLTASNFTNCAAKKGAAVYVKGCVEINHGMPGAERAAFCGLGRIDAAATTRIVPTVCGDDATGL